MGSSVLAFAVLAAGVAAPGPKPPAGVPAGDWAVVASDHDPALGKMPEGMVWTFAGGTAAWRVGDGRAAAGATFAVTADPRKEPREIDLVQEVGGRKYVLRGIYKLDRTRLVLCLGLAAGDAPVNESARPTEFKAGPGVQLLTLERRDK
jgi:uncharacterized protein (TIGR03067 family)